MWIIVALSNESIHTGSNGNKYIDGDSIEKFYFDKKIADELDKDNFLIEMWRDFDAMFDWGDCDYFDAEKSEKLGRWAKKRISKATGKEVREVYSVLYDFCIKAVDNNTGIYFDF